MQTTRVPVPPDTVADRLAILPDMMRQWHMFNMAGFGLPASDYTRLALAMRELVMGWPLKSIRWVMVCRVCSSQCSGLSGISMCYEVVAKICIISSAPFSKWKLYANLIEKNFSNNG